MFRTPTLSSHHQASRAGKAAFMANEWHFRIQFWTNSFIWVEILSNVIWKSEAAILHFGHFQLFILFLLFSQIINHQILNFVNHTCFVFILNFSILLFIYQRPHIMSFLPFCCSMIIGIRWLRTSPPCLMGFNDSWVQSGQWQAAVSWQRVNLSWSVSMLSLVLLSSLSQHNNSPIAHCMIQCIMLMYWVHNWDDTVWNNRLSHYLSGLNIFTAQI